MLSFTIDVITNDKNLTIILFKSLESEAWENLINSKEKILGDFCLREAVNSSLS